MSRRPTTYYGTSAATPLGVRGFVSTGVRRLCGSEAYYRASSNLFDKERSTPAPPALPHTPSSVLAGIIDDSYDFGNGQITVNGLQSNLTLAIDRIDISKQDHARDFLEIHEKLYSGMRQAYPDNPNRATRACEALMQRVMRNHVANKVRNTPNLNSDDPAIVYQASQDLIAQINATRQQWQQNLREALAVHTPAAGIDPRIVEQHGLSIQRAAKTSADAEIEKIKALNDGLAELLQEKALLEKKLAQTTQQVNGKFNRGKAQELLTHDIQILDGQIAKHTDQIEQACQSIDESDKRAAFKWHLDHTRLEAQLNALTLRKERLNKVIVPEGLLHTPDTNPRKEAELAKVNAQIAEFERQIRTHRGVKPDNFSASIEAIKADPASNSTLKKAESHARKSGRKQMRRERLNKQRVDNSRKETLQEQLNAYHVFTNPAGLRPDTLAHYQRIWGRLTPSQQEDIQAINDAQNTAAHLGRDQAVEALTPDQLRDFKLLEDLTRPNSPSLDDARDALEKMTLPSRAALSTVTKQLNSAPGEAKNCGSVQQGKTKTLQDLETILDPLRNTHPEGKAAIISISDDRPKALQDSLSLTTLSHEIDAINKTLTRMSEIESVIANNPSVATEYIDELRELKSELLEKAEALEEHVNSAGTQLARDDNGPAIKKQANKLAHDLRVNALFGLDKPAGILDRAKSHLSERGHRMKSVFEPTAETLANEDRNVRCTIFVSDGDHEDPKYSAERLKNPETGEDLKLTASQVKETVSLMNMGQAGFRKKNAHMFETNEKGQEVLKAEFKKYEGLYKALPANGARPPLTIEKHTRFFEVNAHTRSGFQKWTAALQQRDVLARLEEKDEQKIENTEAAVDVQLPTDEDTDHTEHDEEASVTTNTPS